jgi:CHAT domain-containing protein
LEIAQSSLSQDEAILFNLALGEMRVAVCVRSNHFGIYKHLLANAQQFSNDVRLLQYSISSANPPSPTVDTQFPAGSAVRLYEALIKPAEDCLQPGDTVYAVNRHDGFPFEVLLENEPSKKGAGYNLSDADWAIKKYSFSYIGSVREFLAGRRIDKRPVTTNGFLGVGDPLLTGVTSDGTDIQKHLLRGAVGPNMASIGGLTPLPDTAIELKSILKQFNGQGRILLGTDATESAVRRADLGKYEYLSFATHGLVREEIKGIDEAALVLTPVESTGQLNDGILTASELADLNLNARVAVLSACNTAGVSSGLSAPEIQGLTSALAVAGVPSSVATLTTVDSYSTRLIIEKFFYYLVEGDLSVAQALAKAKTDLINSPPSIEYAHPRFWGPIVAFGNSKKLLKESEPELFTWTRKQYFGTRDAEVIKITSEDEGGTYIVFLDDPKQRQDLDGTWESQTKIAKLNNKLEFDWNWSEFGHGNSATLISTRDSLIFPAQFVSSYSTETSERKYAHSIHAIDKSTGKELWSVEPPENEEGLSSVDGTVTNRGKPVAMFSSYGPSGSEKIWLLELSNNQADFRWLEIYKLDPGSTQFPFGGFVLNLGEELLLGFNEVSKLEPARVFLDEFDNVQSCDNRVDTTLIWLDSKTFEKHNELNFNDFIANSATEKQDGKVVIIGSSGPLCSVTSTPRNLTVVELDGIDVIKRFVDIQNQLSWGRDIAQLPSGHLLLVGSAVSSFGSEGLSASNPVEDGSPAERYYKSKAEDGLLILLDSDYREIGRTWSEIGVDLFFNTANVSQGRILIGGKAGSKAFLGELKIDDSILKTKTQTIH